MENKQTAVEWIEDKWGNAIHWNWEEIKQWFEQAKEMEKEQMLEFWKGGIDCTERGGTSFNQYYKETYGE